MRKNPLPFSRTGSGQTISPSCSLEDSCGRVQAYLVRHSLFK